MRQECLRRRKETRERDKEPGCEGESAEGPDHEMVENGRGITLGILWRGNETRRVKDKGVQIFQRNGLGVREQGEGVGRETRKEERRGQSGVENEIKNT